LEKGKGKTVRGGVEGLRDVKDEEKRFFGG